MFIILINFSVISNNSSTVVSFLVLVLVVATILPCLFFSRFKGRICPPQWGRRDVEFMGA